MNDPGTVLHTDPCGCVIKRIWYSAGGYEIVRCPLHGAAEVLAKHHDALVTMVKRLICNRECTCADGGPGWTCTECQARTLLAEIEKGKP